MKIFGRKRLSKEVKYLVVIIVVLLILCLGFGYCLRFTRIEGMIPFKKLKTYGTPIFDYKTYTINRLENLLKNTKYIPEELGNFINNIIDGTAHFGAEMSGVDIVLFDRFINHIKHNDFESAQELQRQHGSELQYFKDDNKLKDYKKSGNNKYVDFEGKKNDGESTQKYYMNTSIYYEEQPKHDHPLIIDITSDYDWMFNYLDINNINKYKGIVSYIDTYIPNEDELIEYININPPS